MTDVVSIDPRTAAVHEIVSQESTFDEVDAACAAATAAAPALEGLGREGRAGMLEAMALALEGQGEQIVAVADRETGIGVTRLTGELRRTCFQLRLFAEVLRDGGYLEATVDHAGDTPMGPRPDLRRMLVPIGPVAVFGASNFPLAFSVPGGDTVSALAAGSPVVIKAHSSHPATSQLCFDLLANAARESNAPEGTVSLVFGQAAGGRLVAHPAIKAVGFTGSLSGGQALMDIIAGRPDPIPFYGELSSLNPVVVTEAAAVERADEIGAGLVASYTVAAGQLCTKPGLILLPAGTGGDRIVEAMVAALKDVPEQVLLNERIWQAFGADASELSSRSGIDVLQAAAVSDEAGFHASAGLVQVGTAALDGDAVEEHFGPLTVVARYRDVENLAALVQELPSSLTATVHCSPSDTGLVTAVSALLRDRAGRLIYNGYPTGVAVAWGQQHGGPWPSTNSLHTSVGPTAIRRFLRPVTWQDAPAAVIPAELRDGFTGTPRRVDGKLTLAAP